MNARRSGDDAARAAAIVRRAIGGLKPRVALMLGSGLGPIADAIEAAAAIPYEELPGFPPARVEGHAGRIVAGRFAGVPLLCFAGRAHAYEALAPESFRVPVRTARRIGIETLILTNAAGSLRRDMTPGRIMLIADHVNFLGMNPLAGANDDAYGPRFPDMRNAYDPALRRGFRAAARRAGIKLAEGVYLAYAGPSFETAAEIRAFRRLGADAVGMSTVPEAIVARHCGLRVAGLSVIVNLAAGMTHAPPSHAETLRVAQASSGALLRLLGAFLAEAGAETRKPARRGRGMR